MKIWALLRKQQKIKKDIVIEFPQPRPAGLHEWQLVLGEICQALQIGRPVVLSKHIAQLRQFSRTAFMRDDFIEPITFDKFEVEIFPEPEGDVNAAKQ
ncbi:MAG: hypothetical protein LBS18_07730 [Clostridiales bacterium]|jgi:hypothetical protein|nr:hypothetical protein [Clostridiales bacterium]